jgi:hypothetical protein|tara:strand:- start:1410 stop:2192 length:783 start_codon:yes stop_codon:yes gene_type:complete
MSKISFLDGEDCTLVYNDEKHSYTVEGELVPSVTRVVDGAFPKQGLIDWAVRSGADFFMSSVEQYTLSPGDVGMYMVPTRVVQHIYDGIKTAYRSISNEALNTGTAVHKWIEDAIRWKMEEGDAPELPDDEAALNCIEAFRAWAKENEVKWLAIEQKVYSKKYNYAGTVDAVAEVNGELTVIDFKTSAKIYKQYHLQVAAYAQAITEMYGRDVEKGLILRLDKDSGKYQTKTFEPLEHVRVFLSCMELREWSSKRIKNLK